MAATDAMNITDLVGMNATMIADKKIVVTTVAATNVAMIVQPTEKTVDMMIVVILENPIEEGMNAEIVTSIMVANVMEDAMIGTGTALVAPAAAMTVTDMIVKQIAALLGIVKVWQLALATESQSQGLTLVRHMEVRILCHVCQSLFTNLGRNRSIYSMRWKTIHILYILPPGWSCLSIDLQNWLMVIDYGLPFIPSLDRRDTLTLSDESKPRHQGDRERCRNSPQIRSTMILRSFFPLLFVVFALPLGLFCFVWLWVVISFIFSSFLLFLRRLGYGWSHLCQPIIHRRIPNFNIVILLSRI